MSKKPKRLRNLRIREVSLCEQGMNQHSHIVLHKAADPKPTPEWPDAMEVAKALDGASPEVLEIFKAQIEAHNRMLAEFSIDKQESNMTDPNHHFNKAVADYAARHDLPIAKAAVDIISARPDLVEAAYTRDGQTAVAREQAKVAKLYGGAA